jgi:hypothetical protein
VDLKAEGGMFSNVLSMGEFERMTMAIPNGYFIGLKMMGVIVMREST